MAPYGGAEEPLSVICGDAPNPRHPRTYVNLVADVVPRDGPIGLNALWADEECVRRPVSSPAAYQGPWDRPTPPILVIGNTMDPSTPYSGSVTMARQLANARLLTVQGYGHPEFLNPSACAANYIVSYLLDGHLPPNGIVCQQDSIPAFPEVSGPDTAARDSRASTQRKSPPSPSPSGCRLLVGAKQVDVNQRRATGLGTCTAPAASESAATASGFIRRGQGCGGWVARENPGRVIAASTASWLGSVTASRRRRCGTCCAEPISTGTATNRPAVAAIPRVRCASEWPR